MNVVVEDGHASPNEAGVLGFPGSHTTLRSRVDACLKRAIHFLETSASVSVEAPSHQQDEQTAESLPLDEPGAGWPEGLDLKDVLAVEESRETQAAEPPEFAVRDDLRHNGSEPHPAGPRRSEQHVESRADVGFTMDPSDERIPIREPVEVRQDFRQAVAPPVDRDRGPELD